MRSGKEEKVRDGEIWRRISLSTSERRGFDFHYFPQVFVVYYRNHDFPSATRFAPRSACVPCSHGCGKTAPDRCEGCGGGDVRSRSRCTRGPARGRVAAAGGRDHLDRVYPMPAAYHAVRMNGLGSVLTAAGNLTAAATIMAVGSDPRFDFSHAYWLIAGIAVVARRLPLGSAVGAVGGGWRSGVRDRRA